VTHRPRGQLLAHLISLVTEGVFIKYPELKFVLIEAGVCWLPPLVWRLDKNWRSLRQTAPWLDRRPSEIVFEHIYLTIQPIEEPDRPEHFRRMLEMFPADRMVMLLNVCPHELAPVCLGRLGGTTLPSAPGEWIWGREGEILACPWHGWEFDLLTGACLTDRRRLRSYEVIVEDDQIIITVPLPTN
jgi:nitrite reductase/ring-hydroxylating ferredoxin subunit